MRILRGLFTLGGLLVVASFAVGQPPDDRGPGGGRPPRDGRGGDRGARGEQESFVTRVLAFDKDSDGRISKAEMSDERLARLFERTDANKDGFLAEAELIAIEEAEGGSSSRGPDGGDGPRPREDGPGDFGRPGGPGGFGPPGGPPGGRPRPGTVLPPRLREDLELSAEQEEQLDSLQKEVDERLAKILNDDQERRLRELRDAGPGGPPGAFDGPPPGERRGPGDRGPGETGRRPGSPRQR